jgi:mRNA interferase MazF
MQTVVAVAITSNLRLAAAPGNVLCSPKDTGFPKKSTINVSQVVTIDKRFLRARIGVLPPALFKRVEDGLRLVLAL